ncbi:hypothetical protein PBI_SPORTO_55 [Arthrobacter phage Sporto]|nr:hypothetical protein PBI_SPORTO_55 [Arthrobacter phage Sporto]
MIERGQAVVLVVGGMLIGAGVTTLVLKKHYQKIADAEIASVKATYKKHYDDLNGQGKISDVDEPEPDVQEGEELVISNVGVPPIVAPHERVAYHKIRTSEEKREEAEKLAANFGYSTTTREDPEMVNITKTTVNIVNDALAASGYGSSPAEEEELDQIIEDENRDPKTPFIISVDDYMADMEGHEQITLTYWTDDKQLTDDADVLVEDVRKTVGFGNLEKFGHLSGNADTVYVRNMERKVDYEICRENGSYSKDVLGVEDWDNGQKKEPKVKKFRNGD